MIVSILIIILLLLHITVLYKEENASVYAIAFFPIRDPTFKLMNPLMKICMQCRDPCVHASLRISGSCTHMPSLYVKWGDFKVRTALKAKIPQCNRTISVIPAC